MPDFRAKASSMGSRDSVPGSDVDAPAKSGRLYTRVLLGLVAAALAVRFVILGLSIGTSMSLSIPNAENWQDFSLAYVPAVEALKNGFLPYRDFFYPYPPLFLYALTAFSYLPLPSWSSAIPLAGADALTVIPVYLLSRELVGERASLIASMLFVFSPTNLYYVDYLWLNPPLTTLLLLTSIYLLIKGRYGWSAFALALSIGFKQTALFAVPVVLFLLWRRTGQRGEPLRYLLLVVAICVVFSLPYIELNPSLYLDSMFRLPFSFLGAQVPGNYYQIAVGTGSPVTFDTSNWLTSKWQLLAEGVYSPATLALPAFLFLVPSTYSWVYSSSSVLSIVGYLLIASGFVLIIRRIWKRMPMNQDDILRYILYAMLLVFTFYPLYKYYVVSIVPFLVLIVRSKRDAVGFVVFSFVLMLVPRYFASWALLVTLVWLLRRDGKLQSLERIRPFSRGPDRPATRSQEAV